MKQRLFIFMVGMALGASAQAEIKTYAEYVVPVPSELGAFARFELPQAQYSEQDGRAVIQYTLPAELVGEHAAPLVFEGAVQEQGLTHLIGSAGEASCTRQSSDLVCLVSMGQLKVEAGAADRFLEAHVTDAAELGARKRVAALFMSEPIGVVTYRRY